MTEPSTTLRGRRATAGASAAPRSRFGYAPNQISPGLWAWFQGEPDCQMAVLLEQWHGDLVGRYRLFLARTADPATPEGIDEWPELAEMLAAHRAEQVTQKAAAPRKPRGRRV